MEQAITINDGDGYAFVTMVDSKMIQGDFDVDLDVEDMAPRDKEVDKANFVNAITVLAQMPGFGADEATANAFLDAFGVHNKALAKGIKQWAELQQMMMIFQAQGKQAGTPDNAPPRDEATAISQKGGM
jgi:hypothetical protein